MWTFFSAQCLLSDGALLCQDLCCGREEAGLVSSSLQLLALCPHSKWCLPALCKTLASRSQDTNPVRFVRMFVCLPVEGRHISLICPHRVVACGGGALVTNAQEQGISHQYGAITTLSCSLCCQVSFKSLYCHQYPTLLLAPCPPVTSADLYTCPSLPCLVHMLVVPAGKVKAAYLMFSRYASC